VARLPRLRPRTSEDGVSPRKDFDRFMVAVELASNPKIARLSDAEFRCLLTGVWPLAAKARPRGSLRVHQSPAEAADVAHQARSSLAVAKRTLDKLRALGMVERDDALGCETVHDWDKINPSPKASDSPESRRKRQQKSRAKKDTVTPMSRVTHVESHAAEVEVEGEVA
jgi:hypothetical protein